LARAWEGSIARWRRGQTRKSTQQARDRSGNCIVTQFVVRSFMRQFHYILSGLNQFNFYQQQLDVNFRGLDFFASLKALSVSDYGIC
jgi:hypothetical protein